MSTVPVSSQGVHSNSIEGSVSSPKHTFVTGFSLVTFLVIAVCYWAIDHSWTNSVYFFDTVIEEDLAENVTADRLKEVNPYSTVARVALALWGIVAFAQRRTVRWEWRVALPYAAIVFLAMLFLSFLWSINPVHTLFKLTVLLFVGMAAYGIASTLTLVQFLTAVGMTSVVFVMLGFLAEVSLGQFNPWRDYRFVGTTHPNTEAIYGSLLCLISPLFFRKTGWGFWFALALFLFGFTVVWFTKSRTTLVGLLLALGASSFLFLPSRYRLETLLVGFVFGTIAVVAMTILPAQRIRELSEIATMGRGEEVASLTGRIPLWEELLDSIGERPWIGHGYLAYWDAKQVERLEDIFHWEIPHGHNLYLDMMLDVGVLGLVCLIVVIGCALIESVRRYSRTGLLEYGIVLGLIVYATVHGLAESLFKLPGFPMFVMVTCVCYLLIQNEVIPEQHEKNGPFPLENQRGNSAIRQSV